MNKKLFGYAGVIFLLLSVGSSSALIDLTGTYRGGGGVGDPWFNASAAHGITAGDITNWDAAFGWGDHFWNRAGTTLYPTTSGDDVQVNGTVDTYDIVLDNAMFSKGDLDTYWYLSASDTFNFIAGGVNMFMVYENDVQNVVTGNPDGEYSTNVDFEWLKDGTDISFFTLDASDGDVDIDGDLTVTGNIIGNIHYAEAWYHNHPGATITFGVQDQFYNLSFNDTVLNGFTCVDNQNLTCVVAGLYIVNFQASGSGQNNHEYICCVGINDVCQNNTSVHKKLNSGGDIVIMSGTGFVQLSVDDKVTLMMKDWKGTGTGTYHASNLNLVRIGD